MISLMQRVSSSVIAFDFRHRRGQEAECGTVRGGILRKKNLNPKMDKSAEEKTVSLPEGLDAELLGKVLANPEMVALLSSLAKSLK